MYIPAIYNTIVIKKKNSVLLIFYNNENKLKFPTNSNIGTWYFDNAGNSLMFFNKTIHTHWSKLVNKFNLQMFLFDCIFFEKIKFNGKGFKITFKKKTKLMRFMFGHSHIKLIFLKKMKIRRINKYKYILKSKNKNKLKQTSLLISRVRKLNIFTKRGLRITRQFVFKRKGKKSTYV